LDPSPSPPQVHRVKLGVLGSYVRVQPTLLGRAVLPVPPARGGPPARARAFQAASLPLTLPDAAPRDLEAGSEAHAGPFLELAWRLASDDDAASFDAEVPVHPLPRPALAYGHGGFMGLAASMMADERWRTILALEDPGAHARAAALWAAAVAARAAGGDGGVAARRLITLLENSPVLCAYGMVRWGATTARVVKGVAAPRARGVAASKPAPVASVLDVTAVASVHDPPSPPPPASPAATRPPTTVPSFPRLARPPLATVDEDSVELSSLGQAAEEAGAAAAARDLPRSGRGAPVLRPPAGAPDDGEPWAPVRAAAALLRTASDAWTLHARRSAAGDREGSGRASPLARLRRDARVSTVPARLLEAAAEEAAAAVTAEAEARRGAAEAAAASAADAPARRPSRPHLPPPAARSAGVVTDAPLQAPRLVRTATPANVGALSAAAAAEAAAAPPPPPPPPTLRLPTTGPSPTPSAATTPWGRADTPAFAWRRSRDGGGPPPPRGACDPLSEDEEEDEEAKEGVEEVAGAGAPTTAAPPPPYSSPYAPVATEWDVWLCPRAPWLLQRATVDHGSLRRLIAQSIYLRLPGCGGAARREGEAHIAREGISPIEWINRFGRATNRAAAGDPDTPLPLPGAPDFRHRVTVEVDAAAGPALGGRAGAGADSSASRFYVRASILGASARLVPVRTAASTPATDAGSSRVEWRERLSFWPVDAALPARGGGPVLRLDVRRVAATGAVSTDAFVARVDVPLGRLLAGGGGGRALWWAASDARPARARRRSRAAGATHPTLSPRLTGVSLDLGAVARAPLAILRATPSGARRAAAAAAAAAAGLPPPPTDPSDAADAYNGNSPPPVTTPGAPPHALALRLRVRADRVGVLAAAAAVGVAPAAAQTAAALLGAPGGVVLDVKSAYSTPRDLELFCGALAGIGVRVKAVASFHAAQLDGVCRARTPAVALFHGLASLEAACDAGAVPPGTSVFFNGASLLRERGDPGCGGEGGVCGADGDPSAAAADPALHHPLVDPTAWGRYTAAAQTHGFLGGMYVQEAWAPPAAIDALCALASAHAAALPLGFAHGAAPGRAAAAFGCPGRGFGPQAFLDDVASNYEARAVVRARVRAREHAAAPPATAASWGARLLHGGRDPSAADQAALIALLRDAGAGGGALASRLGGVRPLLARFHAAYEVATPLDLFESGVGGGRGAATLMRTLRDAGALAALGPRGQASLAAWLASPALYGWGVTYMFQERGWRAGLHKHAKEGIACLLESCDAAGAAAVVAALGGPEALDLALRGRARLSSSYARRVGAVAALHRGAPGARPFRDVAVPPAANPPLPALPALARAARKAGATVVTAAAHGAAAAATCCAWPALILAPRALAPAARGACGLGVIAFGATLFLTALAAYVAVAATVGADVRGRLG